jgi:hypothetical protein
MSRKLMICRDDGVETRSATSTRKPSWGEEGEEANKHKSWGQKRREYTLGEFGTNQNSLGKGIHRGKGKAQGEGEG